jgi:uncharacterized membrane protein YjjP (DUF1212 family)
MSGSGRERLREQRRHEAWRLALTLSVAAAVAGLVFLVSGAWLAAWIAFGFGVVCAGAAALLLRREQPHATRAPSPRSDQDLRGAEPRR